MWPLFAECWERTILTSENSHSLQPWPKLPKEWNRDYLHSMPSMPKSSTNQKEGSSLLNDLLTMG